MQNLYGFDELIEKFLEREISVSEFERRYLDMFQDESIPIEEDPLFSLLEWLFFEVDAYTDLPLEQDEVIDDYIDEDQLRQSAAKILDEIRALK
ncbi:MAG: hypothetical protein H6869_09275 [Rhodospirillales bacterium]|nr:hypothetical protein [Rhodospirillales bacterium]